VSVRRATPLDDPFAAARHCDRVLVYGTLKRSGRNRRVVADAPCAGTARTEAAFRLHHGHLPTVDRGGRARIEGDLLRVSGAQLARIDQFEGHPDFYRREQVTLDNGATAWIYLHPVPRTAPRRALTESGVAVWHDPRGHEAS